MQSNKSSSKKKKKKSRPKKQKTPGSHDDNHVGGKRKRAATSPQHHRTGSHPASNSSFHPSAQRSAPTEAALALSSKLKELSSRKRLQEALRLYHDASNDAVRDGHHGSIMVDCCSRCGDVKAGERIVSDMEAAGTHVSLQAKTALLKGYSHSGQIKKGIELYRSMCASRDRRDQPNVRTLNTLLRGCLWTAASLHKTNDGDTPQREVSGGVITGEEAWRLSKGLNLSFDASSYEYSIALLCQALRCEEANRRLDEMKSALLAASDGSAMEESVAASALSLARAYALLGKSKKAVEYATTSIKTIDEVAYSASSSNQPSPNTHGVESSTASGGKRSWRQPTDHDTARGSSRRSSSNALFRSHRLSEMKIEAVDIRNLCKEGSTLSCSHLPQYLATRLLYFSGGGTTDLSSIDAIRQGRDERDISDATEQLSASLWLSFGLCAAVGRSTNKLSADASSSMFGKSDRKALRAAGVNPSDSVLSEDGCVDFQKVFGPREESPHGTTSSYGTTLTRFRPINIELGAGAGDWIRVQAIAKPAEDFVSVELRSDRVAQAFAKLMLCRSSKSAGSISNVCCVGAECGSFLRNRIANHSISTVYVNHPEPPTQTYGARYEDITNVEAGSEPAHMLNSESLIAAAKCLKPDGEGRLIIVTDNMWYGQLICKTFDIVMRRERGLLTQVELDSRDGFYRVGAGTVCLYGGSPNEAIAHASPSSDGGSSYFDRLWRTGAGTHAERRKRFAIVMRSYRQGDEERKPRSSTASHRSFKSMRQYSQTSRKSPGGANACAGKKKPNKKKSAAKQKRRNERRLLAKKLAVEHASTTSTK